ncbi:MAG: cell wall hydrolase [Rhodospirillaceae bacterium]
MARTARVLALLVLLLVNGGATAPADTLEQPEGAAAQAEDAPRIGADERAVEIAKLTTGARTVADAADPEELKCLALNIYWEARSEPVAGQFAVAAITMNRVRHQNFPNTICGVVRQGGWKQRHRCQFSWWCDGKTDTPFELVSWFQAQDIAHLVLSGAVPDPTRGALWYHAEYVSPAWQEAMVPTVKIGRHVFYSNPTMARNNES